MTRLGLMAALKRLGERFTVESSNAYGVTVRIVCGGGRTTTRRIENGSGIAGNAGSHWIVPTHSSQGFERLGPFRTQREIMAALRSLRDCPNRERR